jgi:hypothetical protein
MDVLNLKHLCSKARSCLMLPHQNGEHNSIADAFYQCSLALDDIGSAKIDDEYLLSLIGKLRNLMDTTGLTDTDSEGLLTVKARNLNTKDKITLSSTIDELADWDETDSPMQPTSDR